MIKKTVYLLSLVALTIGAAYSSEQVRFVERTASFFRIASTEEGVDQAGRGRRGFNGAGRGEFERRSRRPRGDVSSEQPRGSRRSPERPEMRIRLQDNNAVGSEVPMGDSVDAASPPEGRIGARSAYRDRHERRGRGRAISLEEVAHYTIIFAFAVMLTRAVDVLAKQAVRRSAA